MRTPRHISMAVDLAAHLYTGPIWDVAQHAGLMAISHFVMTTEELEAKWNELPPDKQTADNERHG